MSDECVYQIKQFDTDLNITGFFSESIDDNVMKYIAPNPPDYRSSFSGSALPYANEQQAFENTINVGEVRLTENKFSIDIATPNGYYEDFSNKIVPPQINIYYTIKGVDKNLIIELGNSIPFRTLSHQDNKNEMFYLNEDLPIRTQEGVLNDSAYPISNKLNESFWGLKPAC